MLNQALVLLVVLVVVDADEEDVACIVGHGLRIIAGLDLADGGLGIFVVFQFNHQCRQVDILAGYHHNIGKAFTGGQLTNGNFVNSEATSLLGTKHFS